MKNEWFKDWFASKFYLEVYSHRNDLDAEKLLKLIRKNIELTENATILDVACGNGRHSNYFAELGYNIVGFDLSNNLLKIAQKNKLKNNSKTNYFCADVRAIPLKSTFDLVLNLFTSFGYFYSDEENFSFINFLSNHVNKNGYFVFDYLNPSFVKNNLVKSSERLVKDITISERRKIKNNRVEKEILISDSKIMHRFYESVQLYSFNEIINAFKKNGFNAVNTFGNYSEEKYDENLSERMVIIFKR